jgi:transposase-like protein
MRRQKARRLRRSPAEIAKILAEYARSDLTQQAFADARGLSLSSLSLWLRKAREQGEAKEGPRLVPVRLRSSVETGFELAVPGGATLRIPADFDEDALRRVLEIIAPRC